METQGKKRHWATGEVIAGIYCHKLRVYGMQVAEDVFRGADQRMRPLLMTPLSADVGLLPAGQGHVWRRLLVCMLLGAGCAIFPGYLAQAQETSGNPQTSENVSLPPDVQPTIATSVPALAEL